jgi:hypothetical protein
MKTMEKICPRCTVSFTAKRTKQGFRTYCSASCAGSRYNLQHGQSHSPTYRSWKHMIQRCQNPNDKNFAHYGARGIEVCERWKTFSNFFEDMGLRPEDGTLERSDNSGNYEPSNCCWATRAEQNVNKRNITSWEHDRIIRDGVARGLNFGQIAKLIGKSHGAASSRAYRLGLKSGQPPMPPRAQNTDGRGLELPGNEGKRS